MRVVVNRGYWLRRVRGLGGVEVRGRVVLYDPELPSDELVPLLMRLTRRHPQK